jgi:hypothetical protein
MEVNVTAIMQDPAILPTLSGSAFELGDEAGDITWNNAVRFAKAHPLLNSGEEIRQLTEYLLTFGAWDRPELESMGVTSLLALLVQMVAGDAREYLASDTDGEYREAGGRLYQNDEGTEWFFYVGE